MSETELAIRSIFILTILYLIDDIETFYDQDSKLQS
jgi:hypothetical protein